MRAETESKTVSAMRPHSSATLVLSLSLVVAFACCVTSLHSAPLDRGQRLLKEKKYELAVEELRRAVLLEPGNDLAHNELGAALSWQGHHEEAIDEFQKAINCANSGGLDHSITYLNLLKSSRASGRLQEALKAGDASLQIRGTADAYRERGQVHYELGNLRQAATDWDAATTLGGKEFADLAISAASALFEAGAYAEATDRSQRLASSGNKDARWLLAKSCLAQGKVPSATDLYESLAREYSGVPSGVLVRDVVKGSPAAVAGLRAGDVIIAIDGQTVEDVRFLSEYVSKTSPGNLLQLKVAKKGRISEVGVKAGANPEAKGSLGVLVQYNRGEVDAFFRLGQCCYFGGDYQRAYDLFAKADNQRWEIKRWSAMCLAKLGRREEAESSGLGTVGLFLQPGFTIKEMNLEGVFVSDVIPKTTAAAAGVKRGDVILGIGDSATGKLHDILDSISHSKPGSRVNLWLARDRHILRVACEVMSRVDLWKQPADIFLSGQRDWLASRRSGLDQEPRVAAHCISGENVQPGLADAIPRLLLNAFQQAGRWSVATDEETEFWAAKDKLSSADVDRVKQDHFNYAGFLRADTLLLGRLRTVGSGVVLELEVFDAKTKTRQQTLTKEFADTDVSTIVRGLQEIAAQIKPGKDEKGKSQ